MYKEEVHHSERVPPGCGERGSTMTASTALWTFTVLIAYVVLIPLVIGDHLRKGPIRYWLDGRPVKCTCPAHQLRERHQTRNAHS